METKIKVFLFSRALLLIYGLSIYVPKIISYNEFVDMMRSRGSYVPNYWYWSPDYALNVAIVVGYNFVAFVMIAYPIFAPKTLIGNALALPGFIVWSYGYSLMTSVLPNFQAPDSYATGLATVLLGMILIVAGFLYERDKWISSVKKPSYVVRHSDKRDEGIELI
ncbi:MAG: hypothetical protein RTU30_07790 [Candidatus Thorarchaeota archaeon]